MLPCALISAQISMVGDRYYYVGFAGIGIAVAVLFDWLSRTVRWPLWALVPACAYATWLRGFDWTNDTTLFESSLARGEHHRAAFFLAWRYHQAGDCEHAIPLYEQAIDVDGRAGPDLQACLVELGRYEEAAALGPTLVKAPRVRVTAYLNTARALVQLGRLDEAATWARGGTQLAANDPRAWVMLGNLLGMQGDVANARVAFETARRLSPDNPDAHAGLALIARADEARVSEASRMGLPDPTPPVTR
jgi:tetratricopeptide (TPR) repeat protein